MHYNKQILILIIGLAGSLYGSGKSSSVDGSGLYGLGKVSSQETESLITQEASLEQRIFSKEDLNTILPKEFNSGEFYVLQYIHELAELLPNNTNITTYQLHEKKNAVVNLREQTTPAQNETAGAIKALCSYLFENCNTLIAILHLPKPYLEDKSPEQFTESFDTCLDLIKQHGAEKKIPFNKTILQADLAKALYFAGNYHYKLDLSKKSGSKKSAKTTSIKKNV